MEVQKSTKVQHSNRVKVQFSVSEGICSNINKVTNSQLDTSGQNHDPEEQRRDGTAADLTVTAAIFPEPQHIIAQPQQTLTKACRKIHPVVKQGQRFQECHPCFVLFQLCLGQGSNSLGSKITGLSHLEEHYS